MAHGLPKPDAGLWGVDSLCSSMQMYKILLSSAHQGTTDSLLTRWGAGPSLLAHGGIQVVMNSYGSHKTWAQSGAGYTMRSCVLLWTPVVAGYLHHKDGDVSTESQGHTGSGHKAEETGSEAPSTPEGPVWNPP